MRLAGMSNILWATIVTRKRQRPDRVRCAGPLDRRNPGARATRSPGRPRSSGRWSETRRLASSENFDRRCRGRYAAHEAESRPGVPTLRASKPTAVAASRRDQDVQLAPIPATP
jgi:hypothetical protein